MAGGTENRQGAEEEKRGAPVDPVREQAADDPTREASGDGRRGCGMGFARYKNSGAYCSVVMEIDLERETGRIAVRRIVAAVDAGLAAAKA